MDTNRHESSINTFFALIRVGLWGEADAKLNVNHNLFEGVEWEKIYQLAQEQSVLGLVRKQSFFAVLRID